MEARSDRDCFQKIKIDQVVAKFVPLRMLKSKVYGSRAIMYQRHLRIRRSDDAANEDRFAIAASKFAISNSAQPHDPTALFTDEVIVEGAWFRQVLPEPLDNTESANQLIGRAYSGEKVEYPLPFGSYVSNKLLGFIDKIPDRGSNAPNAPRGNKLRPVQ
ncbi:MAG: hypothetical protein WCE63_23160 [Acidobacteriaceae bacterium]